MKTKIILYMLLAIYALVSAAALGSLIWITSVSNVSLADCWSVRMPTYATIYTESNLATNIVASLNPRDMIYICGE